MMSRTAQIMKRWALLSALVLLAATSATAQLFNEPSVKGALPPGLSKVGIDQRLNEQVPLDLHFQDEQGNTVRLGDYFHPGRPVIISLVYYNCPMLCGEVLNGMSAAFKVLKFTPGKDFEVVTRQHRSARKAGAGGGQEAHLYP